MKHTTNTPYRLIKSLKCAWGLKLTSNLIKKYFCLYRCPKRREIYVLDAGNSRVKVLDDETFAFKTHIVNEGKIT